MKLNSILKVASLGLCLLAGSVYAVPNTVVIHTTAWNGVPSLGGGEFSVVSSNDGTFFSFCMEEFVKVQPNKTYTYTIDKNVLSGGSNVGHTGDTGAGDPISAGTAWLFTAFSNGTLFDAANPSKNYLSNRKQDAGVLQAAIWMLEDETPVDASNVYYAYVQSILGGKAQNAYTGKGVQAMNLWGADRKDVQSVLVLVPDVASSLGLLGLGLASLMFIRRKF